MSIIERTPSFFRVGGLELLDRQRLTIGKNEDGSIWIDIKGPTHARVALTPEQALSACNGVLRALGYKFEPVESPK